MWKIKSLSIYNALYEKLGQRLCRIDPTYAMGKGTYKRQDYIYSSLAGIVNINKKNEVRRANFSPKNR